MGRPSIGLICQPGLEGVVERSAALDVVEIEPQISWTPTRGVGSVLESGPIRAAEAAGAPVLLHSVGVPVGGTVLPDPAQVELLRSLGAHFDCPWVSEHLSILRIPGEVGDISTGVLMATSQTLAAVDVASSNIGRLSEAIDRPIIFETGVNYLRPRPGEMPDGDFFAAVAERADCGILVDLHNLWCNELNGRQRARQVIAALPADQVREIHVASGYWNGDHYLDAHSGITEEPVLGLLQLALRKFPNVHSVVFEVSPDRLGRDGLDTDSIVRHLDALDVAVRTATASDHPGEHDGGLPAGQRDASSASVDEVRRWEAALGGIVIDRPPESALASELVMDPGSRVWRDIALASRRGQFAGALPMTCRLLLLHLGPDRLLDLLGEVWAAHPVGTTSAEESRLVADHIRQTCVDLSFVAEVLAFELALHELDRSVECVVNVPFDPDVVLGAIAAGRLPDADQHTDHQVVVTCT